LDRVLNRKWRGTERDALWFFRHALGGPR
jgi:hypothetical protein